MRILAPAAAILAAAGLLPAAAALAQDNHALTYHSLQDSDLPRREEPFPIWYSPSAEAEARLFAETMADAVTWYRAALDWDGQLRLAVLDESDYERFAGQPYPVPYAELASSLVVMPDSIAAFPGFDAWGIEDRALNTDLTLHEIGHVIASDIGLWSNSFWVNELVANVFLAGYLRAEQPDDRSLLEGVPPAFASAAHTTYLATLDDLYAGVGLGNYAWFQFRLAAIADYLVAGGDFRALVDDLRAAFPAGEVRDGAVMPTPEEAVRRLEELRPGVTKLAGDMLGRPPMAAAEVHACANKPMPTAPDGQLDIENAGNEPLAINQRDSVAFWVRLNLDTDQTGEALQAEIDRLTDLAMETDTHAIVVPPAHRRVVQGPVGAELKLVGRGCVTIGEEPARFVAD